MMVLNAVYLPSDSFIGRPLASSVRWGGRLLPAPSRLHMTQGLGSVYPFARRSVRSNMQLTCTNVRGGTGRVPPCDCLLTPVPSLAEPVRSAYMLSLPSRSPSLLYVDLDSRPPPPKLLTAKILPAVPVDGYPSP